jgi:hypothetical protein
MGAFELTLMRIYVWVVIQVVTKIAQTKRQSYDQFQEIHLITTTATADTICLRLQGIWSAK